MTISSETVSHASLLAARVSVPQHVVYRTFPAETVVLNLKTGTYHGLNPTGGLMLSALERAPTLREAAAALAEHYGEPLQTLERDLCELCDALQDRGLIEIDGAGRT